MSKALLTDLRSGLVYLLDGETSVGRDVGNQVVLNDNTVSRHHATITNAGNFWFIQDDNSSNGVEVNNFRISPGIKSVLLDGYQLKLGDAVLNFTTNAEAIDRYIASQGTSEIKKDIRYSISDTGKDTAVPDSGNKQKRYGPLIKIASIAAVAVILSWCGVNHFIGNKRTAEGNYTSAVSAYQKDFLFSRSKYVKSALSAGEDAYSRSDYAQAGEYFLLAGDAGKMRWSDSVYEQAKELIAAKRYDKAIELLNQISAETRAQEQIAAATLGIAQKQFSAGDIDGAIQTAEGIKNTQYADVISFLDMVYHSVGNDCFAEGKYRDAKEAYEKCEKDSQAQINAEILNGLLDGDYYQAALLADSSLLNTETDLSRKQWQLAFDIVIGVPNMTSINSTLAGEAAKVIVAEEVDFESSDIINSFSEKALSEEMIGVYGQTTKDDFVIDDISTLYPASATDPKGKILIVSQRHDYPDKEQTQVVSLDLMRFLPKEYYPASLDEVEYIVVVNYDYEKEGSYEYITIALRESADVKVLRATDGRQLYSSGRQWGNHAPDSFTYYIFPPDWKSGGAPAMGEAIHKAIASIIG